MKTLLYAAFNRLEIAEAPLPTVQNDEVLLRVAACGVCGSELESFKHHSPRRPPPLVMGHEFCGTIERVGADVRGFETGQKVVSNSIVSCGACVRCKRGDTHLCAQRQVFGMHRAGAFAEFVNVPARVLLEWPDALPAEAACLTEPLANGVHIVNLTRHLKPQTVLVIGAGPIGLMALGAMRALLDATVLICDLAPNRLDAAHKMGARETFDPRQRDAVEVAREFTGGEGVDIVIDAVGVSSTKRQSLHAARAGGAAVWIGLGENEMTLDSYEVTLPEKQVLGTYAATQNEMQNALDLMKQGRVDVGSWPRAFALEDGAQTFERLVKSSEDEVKAILLPT